MQRDYAVSHLCFERSGSALFAAGAGSDSNRSEMRRLIGKMRDV